MPPNREFPILWRLLLPIIAAGVFIIAPQARSIRQELEGSRLATSLNEPGAAAIRQAKLANWEPWRMDLWQQAAGLALRAGNPGLVISSLERVEKNRPLNPQSQLLLGEGFWAQGNPEKAIETWAPLLDQGLGPDDLYRRVIQFRRGTGQLEEAVRLARLWAQANPSSGDAAFTTGLLSLPGAWTESGDFLEKAVKLDAGWSSQVAVLRQALQRSGETAPDEYRLVEIGRALGSLGEWDLALAAFQRAVKINPAYAEAWAFRSEVREQLRQDGSADLAHALELAPGSPLIQALAALEDRRSGRFQEALARFQSAAQLEPKRALWLVEIGNTYADLHDIRKGLESYQKAVQVEPQNPFIWRQLALYCLANQVELRPVGLPAARQANLLSNNDPTGLDTLAQVLFGLDDTASAERFLQQALEKDPDFPAAHLHLGQLFLNQKKMEWAQYHLSLAARSTSQDSDSSLIARRILARFFGGN